MGAVSSASRAWGAPAVSGRNPDPPGVPEDPASQSGLASNTIGWVHSCLGTGGPVLANCGRGWLIDFLAASIGRCKVAAVGAGQADVRESITPRRPEPAATDLPRLRCREVRW